MKMGLREANQNFAKAIKIIKSGKVIVLTERGKPIATISPIIADADTHDELQALRDEGFLAGRRRSGRLRTKPRPLTVKGMTASAALLRERNEER